MDWSCPWGKPLCYPRGHDELTVTLAAGLGTLPVCTDSQPAGGFEVKADLAGHRVAYLCRDGMWRAAYVTEGGLLFEDDHAPSASLDWGAVPGWAIVGPAFYARDPNGAVLAELQHFGGDRAAADALIAQLPEVGAGQHADVWKTGLDGLGPSERARVLAALEARVLSRDFTGSVARLATERLSPTPELVAAIGAPVERITQLPSSDWGEGMRALSLWDIERASQVACGWLPVLWPPAVDAGVVDTDSASVALEVVARPGRPCPWISQTLDQNACDRRLRCSPAGASHTTAAWPLCRPEDQVGPRGHLFGSLLAAARKTEGVSSEFTLRNARRQYRVNGALRDTPSAADGGVDPTAVIDPCGEEGVRENACALPVAERTGRFGSCRLDVDDAKGTITVTSEAPSP